MSKIRPHASVLNGRGVIEDRPTGVHQLPALLSALGSDSGIQIVSPRRTGRVASNLWEQVVLPWRARSNVLVSLANSGPALARRHVVMIHDLSPWDHPGWFGRGYRLKTSVMNRTWSRFSLMVLFPSQFSADRASVLLGIQGDKARVVGNAHRWSDEIPRREPADDPYVLTVSTLSTRKNLQLIVDAWQETRRRRPNLRLKIVGAAGNAVLRGGATVDAHEGVDVLGYVSEAELDALFIGAAALVSASRYEGFNIPVLDALCIGVPTAISDIPVHRELYGDDAEFFDPESTASFVDALGRAINSSPLPSATLADRFAPKAVVDRVVSVLDEARRLVPDQQR